MERCRSYLVAHATEKQRLSPARSGPAVTVAYQTGAGEHEFAKRLAGMLQSAEPKGAPPWTVFDRQLVEKVLEDHHLPKHMARFLPEDRRSFIEDLMEELLGLHLPASVMVPQIAETVLHLAHAGHVVLVGRRAAFITARLPNIFHVRLVAALSSRIERVQRTENLSAKAAAEFIAKTDRARRRYAKAYFNARGGDDLLYHLTVNTDHFPPPEAAGLIADTARKCFQNGAGARPTGVSLADRGQYRL